MDKVSYIYIFSLTVGEKLIAKYVGQHTFTPTSNEIFDVKYRGSGGCWGWLLKMFGFDDTKSWCKIENSDEYEFKGICTAVFNGRVQRHVSNSALTDSEELIEITNLVKNEGLNVDLIKEYRKAQGLENSKLSNMVNKFISKYKHIAHGDGVFVNQIGSLRNIGPDERSRRADESMLMFMIESDKQRFISGELNMNDIASFLYKDGTIKKHKIVHVYQCEDRLGYSVDECINVQSGPESIRYENNLKNRKKEYIVNQIKKKFSGDKSEIKLFVDKQTLNMSYKEIEENMREIINKGRERFA